MMRTPTGEPGAIRPALATELNQLSQIEHEADSVFASSDLAFIAHAPTPDPAIYRQAQAEGRVLVYETAGQLAGFIRIELVDGGPHIEQVSIRPRFARHGIGRALMTAAEKWARTRGFTRMTLTTYRDVPWNMPYYERLGWREITEKTYGPELRALREHERDLGLDAQPRVAMAKYL